jgi:inosine-uridine nucleoside N-ribohydrolase
MKAHLDTDLGGDLDDLCALAMLLKWPNLEITGITTVAEDKGRRAGYVKYALELAGREDIPLKAGADVSGSYFRFEPGYPLEEENWPEPIEPSPNLLDDALELLKNSIEQDAIIIAIGQYTNLALLDRKYPGILKEAKVFLMGGYVYPIREGFPQWGNDTDYNIQLDVASAKHVLENCNPTLIPLSVTVETALRAAYLPGLIKSGKLGELIALQAETVEYRQNEEKLGKPYRGVPADIRNFLHDPLACAVALGWDGVKIEEVHLRFELRDGWLHEVIDDNGKKTKVVTQVDGDKFNGFWFRTITDV